MLSEQMSVLPEKFQKMFETALRLVRLCAYDVVIPILSIGPYLLRVTIVSKKWNCM